jgi:methylmalonyl-CoA mutase
MDDLSLAADFPAPTRERWLALVEGVLKGADYERRLVSRTVDGLRIEPLYPKADSCPLPGRGQGRWGVVQRVDHPDPAAANELALADLAGGADGLALVLRGAPSARGFGLDAPDLDALGRALDGVLLDLISLKLETAPFDGRVQAERLAELVHRRSLDPGTLAVEFGLDPLGDLARSGGAPLPWPELSARAGETARRLAEAGFRGPFLRVDGRPVHEAGGSEGQELAFALSAGVAYLRTLEQAGFPLEEARGALSFLLVADADEFLTVAKFRALRRLWSAVEAACGLEPRPLLLHAETAWRSTTRRDPHVNMLRATIAAFSAGIGGADSVTVLPFTAALGLPDAFARRVARNTSLILLEEANLWRVEDPAAGAGGFEALTESLAEKAWSLFQAIEAEGGLAASLDAGALQARVAAVREARLRALAEGRDALIGTSEFPNLTEATPTVLASSPLAGESLPSGSDPRVSPKATEGGGAGGTAGASPGTTPIPDPSPQGGREKRLPSIRPAEPFEVLRDRSDERLAREGRRPRVFLLPLGSAADHTPRLTFARNFFEAGGIEAVLPEIGQDAGGQATGFKASGARIACLCGSDEGYAAEGAAAASVLSEAGAVRIFIAARPHAVTEPLRAAGVHAVIGKGCDAPAVLAEAQDLA